MDDVLPEFLQESHELLDDVERELRRKDGTGPDLAALFRTFHTIKGASGFLNLPNLERLTHRLENVLAAVRSGQIPFDDGVKALVERAVVRVRGILASLETEGSEPPLAEDLMSDLAARLHDAGESLPPPAEPDPPPATAQPSAAPPVASSVAAAPTLDDRTAARPEFRDRPIGEILVELGCVTRQDVVLAMRDQQKGDPRRLGEILVARGLATPDHVLEALGYQGEGMRADTSQESMEVDVTLLERLMNLVGELVLVRNRVDQMAQGRGDPGLTKMSISLSRVTGELQEGVTRTRMRPITQLWDRLPRLLKHLSVVTGKEVRLKTQGADTPLDRALIEALRDPLTHLVRNAIDHGIEEPDGRRAAGKPLTGTILLSASQQGGQVTLEIHDDGAGIDTHRIRAKAVEKGLIDPVSAARLSESEVLLLIFAPGFSTAREVTSVSGRGVGMDVVRTNIEGAGGTVEIRSTLGSGTTITIKVPLSLAIIPALVISSGGHRAAIPQISLVEVVRVATEEVDARIERIENARFYRLRGELLPVVQLAELFAVEAQPAPDQTLIVVLEEHGQRFGVIVDGVDDTEEIVVTPLGEQLKAISIFAGATILGDNSVALILDVGELARLTEVIGIERDEAKDASVPAGLAGRATERAILVVETARGTACGVELSTVSRLETLARADFAVVGAHRVVRYDGGLLPLVDLDEVMGFPHAERSHYDVIVHSVSGRRVGILVHDVIDIITPEPAEAGVDLPGVHATAWHHGQVVEVFDIPAILARAGYSGEVQVRAA